jgi:hypothetical protein
MPSPQSTDPPETPPANPGRARWSRLFFGAVILIALALGAVALRGYLAMRAANEAVRSALASGEAEAGARPGQYTEQSLELQRQSERLDRRRTLRIVGEPMLVRYEVGKQIDVDIPLMNTGRMPADDVRVFWAFAIAAGDAPVNPADVYRDSVRRYGAVYPAEGVTVRIRSEKVLGMEDSLGCASGVRSLSVRGYLVIAAGGSGSDTLEYVLRRMGGTTRFAGWLRPRGIIENER